MRLALAAFAAAFVFAAQPAAAASVELRNVAARVTIVPQDRADAQVVLVATNPKEPLRVAQGPGGDVVVERADWLGWLWAQPSCDRREGRQGAHVLGGGDVTYDALPQIVVYTPMDAHVDASGAIWAVAGHADSLKLSAAGCGQWTIANVKNDLIIEAAGRNRIRGGRAGRMKLWIAGAATVSEQRVDDGLEVNIAGSGNVHLGQASGPVKVMIAGGGDVRVDGGHASRFSTHIAGSGEIKYGGVADSVDAAIAGSGEIYVAKATGPVRKRIAGSGSIDVGH